MSSKTNSVRVPAGTADVSSENVTAWLDAQLASNLPLTADPGAGERTLRLSPEQGKVKAGAQAADEPEAVFLRRLIASNVRVPEELDQREPEAKPKALVLKGPARLRAEQVMPVVRLCEAGQSYAIRKLLRAPEAVREAAFSEQERELLATGVSEVLNRRAPQQLVQNIDILGLALTVLAVEVNKIEAVQAVAERKRQQQQLQQKETDK